MKEAQCPECGATITFTSPGSLVVVCPFCEAASFRRDVDLDLIGKVAERAPLASHFKIGTEGRLFGERFVVRGQLQLDHGQGLWNEWCAETEAGRWIWLAEAQGEILVLEEIAIEEKLPEREDLEPGHTVRLEPGEKGVFRVTEIGEATVVTAAGELPIRLEPGKRTTYADLAQGEVRVATLDWTRQEVEGFVGRRVELDQLELVPETMPEHRPETVKAREIACPNCGAPIVLHDPEETRRVACSNCEAVLDPASLEVKALQEQKIIRKRPALPLGAEGRILGEQVRILGFMVRSVEAGGQRFFWSEYLLRTPAGGYRFLVESSGHWLVTRPISPDAIVPQGFELHHQAAHNLKTDAVLHRGHEYRHFTTGMAIVDYVLGEFYWDVAVGDRVLARDFVSPPDSISIETTPTELTVSKGRHLSRKDVARAFDHRGPLPLPGGVGMVQPNPYGPLRRWWVLCGAALALFLVVHLAVTASLPGRVVVNETFGPIPGGNPKLEGVSLTQPFDLTGKPGNLVIRMDVPGLVNGWVGLDGWLINLESGEVTWFGISAEHYKGVSGGESWSEGRDHGEAWLGPVPPGRYRLRLAPVGYQRGIGRHYRITARSKVPRPLYVFLAVLFLVLIPGCVSILYLITEGRRWKESDHPWSQES